MTAAIGLTMVASSAYADLGWTAKQTVSNYGKPLRTGAEKDGRQWGDFKSNGYYVSLWFLNGKVSRAAYARVDGARLSEKEVRALITANVGDAEEFGQSYSDGQGNGHIDTTDGEYFSMLSADEKVAAVWTKADNDVVSGNQNTGNDNQQEEQQLQQPKKQPHKQTQQKPTPQQDEQNQEQPDETN